MCRESIDIEAPPRQREMSAIRCFIRLFFRGCAVEMAVEKQPTESGHENVHLIEMVKRHAVGLKVRVS